MELQGATVWLCGLAREQVYAQINFVMFQYQVCNFFVFIFFFFQAEDGIRDYKVTGVQTCALPISLRRPITSDSRAADLIACTYRPRLVPPCCWAEAGSAGSMSSASTTQASGPCSRNACDPSSRARRASPCRL